MAVSSGSPRRRWLLWVVVMALLVASGGIYAYVANVGHDKPALNTVMVTRGDLQVLVTATGVLEPSDFVDMGAQVSGQLDSIPVRIGQRVKTGDLLAEIDPTIYLARVDATRAQLKNQRAQLQDRKAQLKLAGLQFQRQSNLMREDATTREALQSAEASLASAQAQLAMLEAQIEQTSSTLRAEEANLDYARIYAPMDGTVVSIDAREGQTLNSSQQAPLLMRIADLATMRVRAQVSEADISKVRSGMKAYFTTLGNPDSQRYGELEYIEPTPTIENNVVLYNALFNVANADGLLLPSMTAQVFFVVEEISDALLVPATAVNRGQVSVRNAAGEFEQRAVDIGVSNRIQAEILSGLEEGDEILLATSDLSSRVADRRVSMRGLLR
ncbi:MAG: efflux RND transporter periplasmic adaptor subunit [Marinobacter sp.]|uniref:efflux RND transporter periplasmic adaptor subunit n=1 Tax=Marinobacter sp. TaxID=50741 RepID=UPI0034A03C89